MGRIGVSSLVALLIAAGVAGAQGSEPEAGIGGSPAFQHCFQPWPGAARCVEAAVVAGGEVEALGQGQEDAAVGYGEGAFTGGQGASPEQPLVAAALAFPSMMTPIGAQMVAVMAQAVHRVWEYLFGAASDEVYAVVLPDAFDPEGPPSGEAGRRPAP